MPTAREQLRYARRRYVAVAVTEADRVLMLWRHRFITDTWSRELPGGAIEAGETPVEAAAREGGGGGDGLATAPALRAVLCPADGRYRQCGAFCAPWPRGQLCRSASRLPRVPAHRLGSVGRGGRAARTKADRRGSLGGGSAAAPPRQPIVGAGDATVAFGLACGHRSDRRPRQVPTISRRPTAVRAVLLGTRSAPSTSTGPRPSAPRSTRRRSPADPGRAGQPRKGHPGAAEPRVHPRMKRGECAVEERTTSDSRPYRRYCGPTHCDRARRRHDRHVDRTRA